MSLASKEAFLRKIRADPDANTPRLVYSEWLREQEDEAEQARGEFIYLQVRRAEGEFSDASMARELQLLEQYRAAWLIEDRPQDLLHETHNSVPLSFQRGFAEGHQMPYDIPNLTDAERKDCRWVRLNHTTEDSSLILFVNSERILNDRQRSRWLPFIRRTPSPVSYDPQNLYTIFLHGDQDRYSHFRNDLRECPETLNALVISDSVNGTINAMPFITALTHSAHIPPALGLYLLNSRNVRQTREILEEMGKWCTLPAALDLTNDGLLFPLDVSEEVNEIANWQNTERLRWLNLTDWPITAENAKPLLQAITEGRFPNLEHVELSMELLELQTLFEETIAAYQKSRLQMPDGYEVSASNDTPPPPSLPGNEGNHTDEPDRDDNVDEPPPITRPAGWVARQDQDRNGFDETAKPKPLLRS